MIIPKHVRGSHNTGWRGYKYCCRFTVRKNTQEAYVFLHSTKISLKFMGLFYLRKKQQFFVGLKFALIYSVPIFFIGDKTDKFK